MQQQPFYYIAGPCVLENTELALEIGRTLQAATPAGWEYIFKASFDKANRTSLAAYRGPGLEAGLEMLKVVRDTLQMRVLTDVHETAQAEAVAEVVDIIQIPAFLSRQTDLLVAAARTGKIINIKKAQFMAPEDMRFAVEKVRQSGNEDIWLTERGSCFGYHNLVVDFRAFTMMRDLGCPVIFDATHSVQIPSQGGKSGGRREFVAPLARAAMAYGIDGLFTEVYPDPDQAKCDGPNSLPLHETPALLASLSAIRKAMPPQAD